MGIGTPVEIKGYSKEFNGKKGVVDARNGEYYTIKLNDGEHPISRLHDIYHCELIDLSQTKTQIK